MKKTLVLLLGLAMLLSLAACAEGAGTTEYKYERYATMTPEAIVAELTLAQKAAQMVQPILYRASVMPMQANGYGSIYGDEGALDAASWRRQVDMYQKAAISSEAGIPYVMAQDDVHGVGYCIGAVYFPHNIGQGAANDEDLAYQVGRITADEARQCHMLWNLYPCVAQSNDPRWGRNYECYGSDLETIARLSAAYTRGLMDGGVIACAKHYFGEGNVLYGTGEQSDYPRLIDRGDARLTDAEIDALLKVYQAQIDAGVQTIMVSYSSLNGVKMHENGEYIWKLKNEMGFEGFVVSDSMAIKNTSPETYEEQVVSAINCGIDMLMEGERYDDAMNAIIDAVNDGRISEERVDEAVTRIIRVKKDAGLFDDPLCEHLETVQAQTGSAEYRAVAEELVEKSLVLVKNEGDILPIKEGAKIYVTGPAADDAAAQCGGWTMGWNGSRSRDIFGVTTIKKAFEAYAGDYGVEVITDPERAEEADVVLLCVGEKAYAEWYGDTEDLALCGMLGLEGNREAIDAAKALGKPTVTCVIAGRQVILDADDYDSWDGVVMCYLPGSEGKGIPDVLCGCADFTGRLPEPWYGSVDQIGTDECFLEAGYGLSYGEGFAPRAEASAASEPEPEPVSEAIDFDAIAAGTNYTKGVRADGVYTNEYADITVNIPDELYPYSDASILARIQSAVSEISEDGMRYYRSVIWDSVNEGTDAIFVVKFANTDIGVPDNPRCTEDEYLDYCKASDMKDYASLGDAMAYDDRTTVTLGGHAYVRERWRLTHQGETLVVSYYARRLDDHLICVIEAQCRGRQAKDPDFCEAWFE
ncbi:MAG: glycoside hydrolase family 3 protein [Clostridia bacterium]|nr:glycoside hydrolase family 3 protein [Clostridia bacterium]